MGVGRYQTTGIRSSHKAMSFRATHQCQTSHSCACFHHATSNLCLEHHNPSTPCTCFHWGKLHLLLNPSIPPLFPMGASSISTSNQPCIPFHGQRSNYLHPNPAKHLLQFKTSKSQFFTFHCCHQH